jgi:hypothetical protein
MLIHDRFVFIHLQKTAGTFLADALRRELPAGSLVRGAKGILHPGWDEIPDEARDRPVLAYVRNPWDWYVSWYHYVMSQAPGSAVYRILFGNGRNDFGTSIRNACAGLVEPGRPERVRFAGRGDDFYTTRFRDFCGAGIDSELLTVGRFESLVDDLERFLDRVGVSLSAEAIARIRTGKPLKVTAHQPYREYYDDDLRDLVGDSCRTLVERFDYAF